MLMGEHDSSGYLWGTEVMLYPTLEEKLRKARLALDAATSESIIELCKQYLALLAEYRAELYKLPATLDLNRRSKSSSARAEVSDTRKEVRAAIEETTSEREWAEGLILWFTAVSGYGAVETLNRGKFRGHDNWELRASGVGRNDGAGAERMTIQDAVDAASLLRREEYIALAAAKSAATANDAFVISGKPG
jgi:hypothetical protein